MAYKELEYLDLCSIMIPEAEVDSDGEPTGEIKYNIKFFNQECDYQGGMGGEHKGVVVGYNPKLFLPYKCSITDLSLDCEVYIVRRFRGKSAYMPNPNTHRGEFYDFLETYPNIIKAQIEDFFEVNIRNKVVGIQIELREVQA